MQPSPNRVLGSAAVRWAAQCGCRLGCRLLRAAHRTCCLQHADWTMGRRLSLVYLLVYSFIYSFSYSFIYASLGAHLRSQWILCPSAWRQAPSVCQSAVRWSMGAVLRWRHAIRPTQQTRSSEPHRVLLQRPEPSLAGSTRGICFLRSRRRRRRWMGRSLLGRQDGGVGRCQRRIRVGWRATR